MPAPPPPQDGDDLSTPPPQTPPPPSQQLHQQHQNHSQVLHQVQPQIQSAASPLLLYLHADPPSPGSAASHSSVHTSRRSMDIPPSSPAEALYVGGDGVPKAVIAPSVGAPAAAAVSASRPRRRPSLGSLRHTGANSPFVTAGGAAASSASSPRTASSPRVYHAATPLLTPILPMADETTPLAPRMSIGYSSLLSGRGAPSSADAVRPSESSGGDGDSDDGELPLGQSWFLLVLMGMVALFFVLLTVIWPGVGGGARPNVREYLLAGSERRLVAVNPAAVSRVDVRGEWTMPGLRREEGGSGGGGGDTAANLAHAFLILDRVPRVVPTVVARRALRLRLGHSLTSNDDGGDGGDSPPARTTPATVLRFQILPGAWVDFSWIFERGTPEVIVLRSAGAYRIWKAGLDPPANKQIARFSTTRGQFNLTDVPSDVYFIVFHAPHTVWRDSICIGAAQFDIHLVGYELPDAGYYPTLATNTTDEQLGLLQSGLGDGPQPLPHSHCPMLLGVNRISGNESNSTVSSCRFAFPEADGTSRVAYVLLAAPAVVPGSEGGTGRFGQTLQTSATLARGGDNGFAGLLTFPRGTPRGTPEDSGGEGGGHTSVGAGEPDWLQRDGVWDASAVHFRVSVAVREDVAGVSPWMPGGDPRGGGDDGGGDGGNDGGEDDDDGGGGGGGTVPFPPTRPGDDGGDAGDEEMTWAVWLLLALAGLGLGVAAAVSLVATLCGLALLVQSVLLQPGGSGVGGVAAALLGGDDAVADPATTDPVPAYVSDAEDDDVAAACAVGIPGSRPPAPPSSLSSSLARELPLAAEVGASTATAGFGPRSPPPAYAERGHPPPPA